MGQAVVLYMSRYEEMKSAYGDSYHAEVKYLYQLMWTDDTLILRFIGRNKLDERTLWDPQLAWRYVRCVGSEDLVFKAENILELDVYVPPETNHARSLDLRVQVLKPRLLSEGKKAVEERHTFYIWPGCEVLFLETIREYSASANLGSKESDHLPQTGACGKALTWTLIVLWIVGLLACCAVPVQSALILLSLLPGLAAFVLFLLFPHKLVEMPARGEEPVRAFAQISILCFSILMLFPTGFYEILSRQRLRNLAIYLFAALAALLLLRIKAWKVSAKCWLIPLAAMLIFSFGAVKHVNYAFDAENARCVETTINHKSIYISGVRYRSKVYYLGVNAEGHQFKKCVDKNFYNACEIGDPAEVYFFEGALGIGMAIVNIELE